MLASSPWPPGFYRSRHRWESQPPPWSLSPCSPPCAGGYSDWWIDGSTALDTTPRRRSPPSPTEFGTMSIWRWSAPSLSTPFSPQRSRLTSRWGCGRLDQAPEHDRQEAGGAPRRLAPREVRVIVGWLSPLGSVLRRELRGAYKWTH